jgi:tetratricopeptide (TPR) repeat protein
MEAMEILRSLGPTWYAAYPPLYLGQMAFGEGKKDEAIHYLEQAISVASGSGDMHALRLAHALLAEQEVLDVSGAAALHRLEPWLDRSGLMEQDVLALLPVQASAYLSLGEYERAEQVAAGAVGRASAQGFRLYLIDALRILGKVLAEQGRHDEARRYLGQSLTLAREVGYPHAEGRVLTEMGLLEMRAGDRQGGVRFIKEADGILQLLRAEPLMALSEASYSRPQGEIR